MKPPKVLYIGANDVSVKEEHLEGEAGHFDDDGIRIKKKLSPSDKRDTFLHEALHAIVYLSGMRKTLELDRDTEEKFVVSITPWILAMLRDNPVAVEYLMENREREY